MIDQSVLKGGPLVILNNATDDSASGDDRSPMISENTICAMTTQSTTIGGRSAHFNTLIPRLHFFLDDGTYQYRKTVGDTFTIVRIQILPTVHGKPQTTNQPLKPLHDFTKHARNMLEAY